MTAKKTKKKPKGTHLTKLDEPLRTVDGHPIMRPRETVTGGPIFEIKVDDDGNETEEWDQTPYEFTRRMAILLAASLEVKGKEMDAKAKLQQGYFQRLFWDTKVVDLEAEEVVAIKEHLNNRWGGVIYSIMCEYLEGGATS